MYVCIYVYVYVCMCACVCVCVFGTQYQTTITLLFVSVINIFDTVYKHEPNPKEHFLKLSNGTKSFLDPPFRPKQTHTHTERYECIYTYIYCC